MRKPTYRDKPDNVWTRQISEVAVNCVSDLAYVG